MPELPEVETIARYLDSHLQGAIVQKVRFYRADLREAIPVALFRQVMQGQKISQIFRRSKYLLLASSQGYGLIHLGMTGNLLLQTSPRPTLPHTHLICQLQRADASLCYLHFVDPRRFGRISAHKGSQWQDHPFLVGLGCEPLAEKRLGAYLWQASRGRKAPIKNFLMDNKVVVGVGNIYACESLFRSGLHPAKPCGELSRDQYQLLARVLKQTLRAAIVAGGTSFRDFKDSRGQPGYFALSLQVYGRKDQPCPSCATPVQMLRQGGRSSWFCPVCQI